MPKGCLESCLCHISISLEVDLASFSEEKGVCLEHHFFIGGIPCKIMDSVYECQFRDSVCDSAITENQHP